MYFKRSRTTMKNVHAQSEGYKMPMVNK